MARRALLVLTLLALASCSDTSRLLHSGTASRTTTTTAPAQTRTSTGTAGSTASGVSVYLAQLAAEQTKLAAAEKRIPTNPRTPAALARSIDLLTVAVRDLERGLAAIRPPASVASEHAHLVQIMRDYAGALGQAAQMAVRRNGEPQAGRLLISATNAASQAFTSTIAKIDSTLGGSPT
jgi:hypothetical protein